MPQTRRGGNKVSEMVVAPSVEPTISTSWVLEDIGNMSDVTSVLPVDVPKTSNDPRQVLRDRLKALMDEIAVVKKQLKKIDDTAILKEAMRLYYHEYKTHPDLIAHVRTTIGDVNLPVNKQGKIIIPHQLLRKGTDDSFNTKIDQATRDIFLQRAVESLRKKLG